MTQMMEKIGTSSSSAPMEPNDMCVRKTDPSISINSLASLSSCLMKMDLNSLGGPKCSSSLSCYNVGARE